MVKRKRLSIIFVLIITSMSLGFPKILAKNHDFEDKSKLYQLYLINCDGDDKNINAFRNIIQEYANFQELHGQTDFLSLESNIGKQSLLIIVGHGSPEGLEVNNQVIPWNQVAAFLTNVDPYKIFLASCYSNQLELYYSGYLINLPYNGDSEITAYFTLFHILQTYYEVPELDVLSPINKTDFLASLDCFEDLLQNKASERTYDLVKNPSKFKQLSSLHDVHEHLDYMLKDDSNGETINYWVYDNNLLSGYNNYGTKVDFATWENEGNNAINIVWDGFTMSEVSHGFSLFGWSHLTSPTLNYVYARSGPLAEGKNPSALVWEGFPPVLYDYHCRLWDLSTEDRNIVVGQCHKTRIISHVWGYYEEIEGLLADNNHWNELYSSKYGWTAYAEDTFPQTWRHYGSTNHPGDWEDHDHQDGVIIFITKGTPVEDSDVDNDGVSNVDEISVYRSDPWEWDNFGDKEGIANPVSFSTYYDDWITTYDYDWIRFHHASADEFTLKVNQIEVATIVIILYSTSSQSLTFRKYWIKSPGSSLTYPWDTQSWGTSYHVKIYYYSGSGRGEYRVRVDYIAS